MQSIENKVVSKIYGKGRGWAFSQKDLSALGSRDSINISLHRLVKKGTIRRVMRGIYDYPIHSELLNEFLSPNMDQVAQAISRKFGWRIQPSGQAAQNIIGLSTQVPARYLYLSDGPDRTYQVNNIELVFQNTALKEIGFKLRESELIVQAIKSLGNERINPKAIKILRAWLPPELREKVLKETSVVTDWVLQAIKQICRKGN